MVFTASALAECAGVLAAKDKMALVFVQGQVNSTRTRTLQYPLQTILHSHSSCSSLLTVLPLFPALLWVIVHHHSGGLTRIKVHVRP